MIENKKDPEATRLARKAGEIHAPSWISFAGHVYLENSADKQALRLTVMACHRCVCAICKEYCGWFDGDLDHIRGGRKFARCWCFLRRLSDGTKCTNVQWVHGMFSAKPCHRQKHNREVKWTKKSS
jgi:hypothetical protein